ncbi:hypothetical protein NEHOM01_0056 [Nematocida homosporus]|uniref:uncharacterized protein n=1 Tax=Nematocida homosporus TaxID=1912981 RepID=UPI00221EC94B|nr:uncharacterized protein NEHOM01_0056 [Nematocida homosporus]KAI5184311.1 hypothetical protein NEHOM01_0056 [Nematocida homosporus]
MRVCFNGCALGLGRIFWLLVGLGFVRCDNDGDELLECMCMCGCFLVKLLVGLVKNLVGSKKEPEIGDDVDKDSVETPKLLNGALNDSLSNPLPNPGNKEVQTEALSPYN